MHTYSRQFTNCRNLPVRPNAGQFLKLLMTVKPKFHLARHVTSRHHTLPSPCILAYRAKSRRDVSRLSDSMARHVRPDKRDSHDTCSGASPQRGLWWTCPPHFFQEVVPETDPNPAHKRLKLVHASTTASSSSAMLEQARRDTLVTTRSTRRTCRVETWRAKWNLHKHKSTRYSYAEHWDIRRWR